MISKLSITGLRGFAEEQSVTFAQPNGAPGSGLTVLVGPNSGGKSTVVEAVRMFVSAGLPTISEGRRNVESATGVRIVLEADGNSFTIRSRSSGNSVTIAEPADVSRRLERKPVVVQSRRAFDSHFQYLDFVSQEYTGFGAIFERNASVGQFPYRLIQAERKREKFDALMSRVIDPPPDWSIDQSDQGQHYLRVTRGYGKHSSEGLGEGILSLLMIIDALYDSLAGDIIVVDEPELSLHPALQRRLAAVFLELSSDRQIVLATHSPLFVHTPAFGAGQLLVRVYHDGRACRTAIPDRQTLVQLAALTFNLNNPHAVGTDAKEVFFLQDGVILVEGQEDVIFYPKVFQQLSLELQGDLFGWGVGGADNMPLFARLLHELGFRRVAGLLDLNKAAVASLLQADYPEYHFDTIPCDDIRSKPKRRESAPIYRIVGR